LAKTSKRAIRKPAIQRAADLPGDSPDSPPALP
jgi:hypothetical protein